MQYPRSAICTRGEWRSFVPVRSVRARLGIVAGILAALALGYAALHSPAARRLALGLVLRRLERSGIVARADDLDYNLATLRFHLSNLTLATPSATSTGGEPFFTARDVRVRLAPATLIGRIVLKDVAIDEPRVALIATSDGTTNWPGGAADKPSGSSSPPDILIEHARVTELGVRWRDSQASIDVGVSFELATNGKETSGRIVATRPGRIDWKGHQTTVQALDGRLSWNGSDVSLGAFTMHLPEGTVTADGRIEEVTADPRLDMRVVAEADLSALAPWLETDRAIRGTSRADVKLAGPLQRPEASFSLTGHEVAVAGVPKVSFDAAGRVTEQVAEITSLRARLAGGLVSASGRTTFGGPGTMRAEWHGVDLASVVRDVWKDSTAEDAGHPVGDSERHARRTVDCAAPRDAAAQRRCTSRTRRSRCAQNRCLWTARSSSLFAPGDGSYPLKTSEPRGRA